MLIVQIKKIKWRDLDYLFNGIRVLLVCSLNIPEAAQDPKHTRRKYEKERRKDLRPQTPDPSGTFFINIFILLKTVGGSILVKININYLTIKQGAPRTYTLSRLKKRLLFYSDFHSFCPHLSLSAI